MKISGWAIVCLLILIGVGLWYSNYAGYWSLSSQTAPKVKGSTSVATGTPESILFTASDPVAGGMITSAALKLYTMTDQQVENLTTGASTGAVTTNQPYAPGTQLFVTISKSGYVTRTIVFTVPTVVSYTTYNQPVYSVFLQTIKLGTFTITCTNSTGAAISSASTYNFTTTGASQISMTFSIFNSVDNTGYWSCYDQLNAINNYGALVTTTPNSYITVTASGSSGSRGTTMFWVNVLPDGYPQPSGTLNAAGLTRQKIGNNYVVTGQSSTSMTFNKGSLTHGTSQTFTLKLYDYFDPTYYTTNGIGGPNSAALATFTISFAA